MIQPDSPKFLAQDVEARHSDSISPGEGVADETQATDFSQVTEREKLADVQHDIWSHWMRWQFSCCKVNQDGSLTIPSDKVERWQRQMDTSYSSLSDNEQESDRHQADKIIGVLDNCNATDQSRGC